MANDPTPLLELARRQLETHRLFDDFPNQREGMIQERARAIVIYRSPIGKAAVRIGAALDALLEEIETFMSTYVDDTGTAAAIREALDAAGLNYDAGDRTCNPDHFDPTIYELNTWRPVLEVMRERLEDCQMPFPQTADVEEGQ